MDVADDHPAARVIGIDLSPIQPTAVPPNLEFQIMDADEEWDFNERFDLIHTRLMNGVRVLLLLPSPGISLPSPSIRFLTTLCSHTVLDQILAALLRTSLLLPPTRWLGREPRIRSHVLLRR